MCVKFNWVQICGGFIALTALVACASEAPTVKPVRHQITQDAPPPVADPIAAKQTGPFADWAAVIVSADQRAASGQSTQAFDNARRELTTQFVAAGFSQQNIAQFSASRGLEGGLDEPTPAGLKAVLGRMMGRAGKGCFVYVTSHGNKSGIVFGSSMLSPEGFADILDRTCGLRPTVAVVSACYSGVFLEALEAPHRMVMTAARPDRNSFGCGEGDLYPYFDACVIEELPDADTFHALAGSVQTCVAAKERAGKLKPSEPQLIVGEKIKPILSAKKFQHAD